MKILYAIQGTGSGNLSRARDIYPELCRHAEVDVLVSGLRSDEALPFPVRHRLQGLPFVLGDGGGLNVWSTLRKLRVSRFLRDAMSMEIGKYDVVVNDFEPVSAWAARMRRVPCVSLSHQWAVLHALAPVPDVHDWKGLALLKHYAPCSDGYGFHFKAYNKRVFTPVIRREVRALEVSDAGHYTVYLPAYDTTALLPFLQRFDKVRWEVFSAHCGEDSEQGNVRLRPLEHGAFLGSLASSSGVLCSAGFDLPAEALYLGKKLMVIPMEGQYEQQCNAAALATLNVPSLKKLSLKYYDRVLFWLSGGLTQVSVNYPDQTGAIVDTLVEDFLRSRQPAQSPLPMLER